MASENIFSQYLRPVKSVAEYSADMDTAEQNKLALAAGRMKAQIDQQVFDDDKAVRMAYAQSGGDQNKLMQLLQTGGQYKAGQALQKSQLDSRKTEADIGKTKADTDKAIGETAKTAEETRYAAGVHHAQELDYINDPADIPGYFERGAKKGLWPAEAVQGMIQRANQMPSLEAFKEKAKLATIPLLDQFKTAAENARNAATVGATTRGQDVTAATAKEGQKVTMRGQDIGAQTAAAGHSVTMRGQNMTDARSRESNAASMSKPFEVTGPDGVPVLVRLDKQGNISRVEGFSPKSAAEKPMTDAQAKAALFGTRMEAANDILNTLASEKTTTSIPGTRTGFGVGAVLNTVSSENQQKLTQAKRDFVNAVLRRESGAVISDSEFENADKQYFPQIGDGPKVQAQKKANREIAIRGIQAEVPKAQRGVLAEIKDGKPATPGAPKPIKNDADYNALPSGAEFVGPDGKTRRKP